MEIALIELRASLELLSVDHPPCARGFAAVATFSAPCVHGWLKAVQASAFAVAAHLERLRSRLTTGFCIDLEPPVFARLAPTENSESTAVPTAILASAMI